MTLKCLNFHNLDLFTCNIILHQKNGQYESVLKFTKFAYAITFNNTQQCQFINIDLFPRDLM